MNSILATQCKDLAGPIHDDLRAHVAVPECPANDCSCKFLVAEESGAWEARRDIWSCSEFSIRPRHCRCRSASHGGEKRRRRSG